MEGMEGMLRNEPGRGGLKLASDAAMMNTWPAPIGRVAATWCAAWISLGQPAWASLGFTRKAVLSSIDAVCAPMHSMKCKNDQQNNAIRGPNGSAKPS